MTMLSVVIPALNEEDGIADIIQRVLAVRPALAAVGVDELELIVVDDGSTDRTPAIVAAQPGVQLARHWVNRGYGAALKTGFALAQGEWIGFLDADGTYPPEYFPHLYHAAQERRADIVIGSRMAGAESEMPAVRRLGNRLFAGLVSLISARHITDSASGMRIFKRTLLPRLYPLPDGLNLTPVMSTRALHEHLTMTEVPIPYSERVGRSKLNVLRDGMRFAQSIVWTALSYNPVRPLGLIGLSMLALNLLIALGLLVMRLQGINALGPLAAFMVFAGVVLAVAGLCILMLGSSFNYFVALFHKTPVRQGLFGRPILRPRPEPYFGVVGVAVLLIGLIIGLTALAYGLAGMPMARLWFYYLTSAGLTLIGVQLIVAWVQMQVLEALSLREQLTYADLEQTTTERPFAAPLPEQHAKPV